MRLHVVHRLLAGIPQRGRAWPAGAIALGVRRGEVLRIERAPHSRDLDALASPRSAESTTMAAPSPTTKPSRRRSKGRETPRAQGAQVPEAREHQRIHVRAHAAAQRHVAQPEAQRARRLDDGRAPGGAGQRQRLRGARAPHSPASTEATAAGDTAEASIRSASAGALGRSSRDRTSALPGRLRQRQHRGELPGRTRRPRRRPSRSGTARQAAARAQASRAARRASSSRRSGPLQLGGPGTRRADGAGKALHVEVGRWARWRSRPAARAAAVLGPVPPQRETAPTPRMKHAPARSRLLRGPVQPDVEDLAPAGDQPRVFTSAKAKVSSASATSCSVHARPAPAPGHPPRSR